MDILDRLYEYNNDELFYREYYNCTDKEQINSLIERTGRSEIIKRRLLVPEINADFLTPFDMGEGIFSTKGKRHICLSKHNRYTPEFLHSHTYFELIYVMSGSCKHTVSGQPTVLSQGSFCIVAPKVYHSIGVFDDSVVLNILVRKSTIETYYPLLLKSENTFSDFFINSIFAKEHAASLTYTIESESSLHSLICEMYREQLENKPYSEEIISSLMQIVLYRLARSGDKFRFELSALHRSDSAKIYRYLAINYQSASLNELAGTLGYTPTYCSAYVKKVTGQSFSKLHRMFLLKKATQLLETTKLSIVDISDMLGYSECESFIRAFRNEFGISPAKYRAQLNFKNPLP